MFEQVECVLSIVNKILCSNTQLMSILLNQEINIHRYINLYENLLKLYKSFFRICRHNFKFKCSIHNKIIYFNNILLYKRISELIIIYKLSDPSYNDTEITLLFKRHRKNLEEFKLFISSIDCQFSNIFNYKKL